NVEFLVCRPPGISIHAPREGSDPPGNAPGAPHRGKISIHAPREGSDLPDLRPCYIGMDFYPRSPRGERRGPNTKARAFCADFYPRSPRGERPFAGGLLSWIET